jgi:hypothetical protein
LINDDERQSIQDLTKNLGVPLEDIEVKKREQVVNASDDIE